MNNIGDNKYTSYFKKMLKGDMIDSINNYISDVACRSYTSIPSENDISNYVSTQALYYGECEIIRRATAGVYNKEYNDMLRGKSAINATLRNEIEDISSVIKRKSSKVDNIVVYRGVPIRYFNDYGIQNVKDLKNMGQFIIDPAFVSTSLLKDRCYYGRTSETGEVYNVLLEYYIPKEFDEGIYLEGYDLTYYSNEKEYLINKSQVGFIGDIDIDEVNNTAVISVVMVPSKVYTYGYDKQKSSSR